jgi:hypothetical protein
MGYSGFDEYLCESGHYTEVMENYGAGENPVACSCGKAFAFTHNVNYTNGYANQRSCALDLGQPYDNSYSDERAPKTEIGFDDVWNMDHHGNQYATKLMKYKPGLAWVKLKPVESPALD